MKIFRKHNGYYVIYHLDNPYIEFYNELFELEMNPKIFPFRIESWRNFINNDLFKDKYHAYSCSEEEINILEEIFNGLNI